MKTEYSLLRSFKTGYGEFPYVILKEGHALYVQSPAISGRYCFKIRCHCFALFIEYTIKTKINNKIPLVII